MSVKTALIAQKIIVLDLETVGSARNLDVLA